MPKVQLRFEKQEDIASGMRFTTEHTGETISLNLKSLWWNIQKYPCFGFWVPLPPVPTGPAPTPIRLSAPNWTHPTPPHWDHFLIHPTVTRPRLGTPPDSTPPQPQLQAWGQQPQAVTWPV